jgi:hypothetical protein
VVGSEAAGTLLFAEGDRWCSPLATTSGRGEHQRWLVVTILCHLRCSERQKYLCGTMENRLVDQFEEAEHQSFITRQLEANAIDTDHLETWLTKWNIHMDSSLAFVEIVML